MKWEKELQKDVIEWDVVNWSRAVSFWPLDELAGKSLRVLELGARRGGLSLLFAQMGIADDDGIIICSDLTGPSADARVLHEKYHAEDRVSYAAVDAVKFDERDAYDVICFKSVLGGIGYNDNRRALGRLDQAFDRFLPEKEKYIISVSAQK